jgi:hypothetical protein
MANAERQSFQSALANDPSKAAANLRDAINRFCKPEDPIVGWYLQKVANYLLDADPGEYLQVQRSAYEKNNFMLCPPGVAKRPAQIQKYDVQAKMIQWLKSFENPNGAIAEIEDLRARLSFNLSPAMLEQAISDLAQLLGAEGSRPEKEGGEGPDDLWLWPDISFVIEVKNQNEDTLHKGDAEQMTFSLEWFKKAYPTRDHPVSATVAKMAKSDHHAPYPDRARALLPEGLQRLLDALEQFYKAIIAKPFEYSEGRKLTELQRGFKLMPDQIATNYTVEVHELRE